MITRIRPYLVGLVTFAVTGLTILENPALGHLVNAL
jgi:hypothetical protein